MNRISQAFSQISKPGKDLRARRGNLESDPRPACGARVGAPASAQGQLPRHPAKPVEAASPPCPQPLRESAGCAPAKVRSPPNRALRNTPAGGNIAPESG